MCRQNGRTYIVQHTAKFLFGLWLFLRTWRPTPQAFLETSRQAGHILGQFFRPVGPVLPFVLYKVNEFVSFICFMFLGLVSPFKVWFRFSGLKLYSFFNFRRLFGARQSTARVSLAHVVMSSPASANTGNQCGDFE